MTDHIAGEIGRWMIFAAGLVVLVASLILPAQADLRMTRMERDRTLHIERAHEQRIDRYRGFLNQLASPDEQTIELLAMAQLGKIPGNREALVAPGEPGDTLLLEAIEPEPTPFVETQRPLTRLERITSDQRTRLWVIAGGLLAVLYGLLPATKP
jgi:hypothetical protein